jgi:hypothetical protein
MHGKKKQKEQKRKRESEGTHPLNHWRDHCRQPDVRE